MPKRTHAYHLAATRARQVRREREIEMARRQKRRGRLRRMIPVLAVVVVALIVLGLIALFTGGTSSAWPGPALSSAATTTSTTTVSSSAYTTTAACIRANVVTLRKPVFATAPRPTINIKKKYQAILVTDLGPVTVRLDAAAAPYNVNNFVYLAENHYYDCQPFSLAGVGYLVQAGPAAPSTPSTSSPQGPRYHVRTENLPKHGPNWYAQWSVVLVNGGGGASGAQLAIVEGPVGRTLPPHDPVIGTVISGSNHIVTIASQGGSATNHYAPHTEHRIEAVTITES